MKKDTMKLLPESLWHLLLTIEGFYDHWINKGKGLRIALQYNIRSNQEILYKTKGLQVTIKKIKVITLKDGSKFMVITPNQMMKGRKNFSNNSR